MAEDDLQERLKGMSPEQIRELQKQQCVFCRIAEGKVQARKVYEDDAFLAVLDINPATPGHILVLPKEHYSILPQLPEELIAHLGMLAKHLSQAALRALKAHGTTVTVANGLAAGQRASHFLMHVIPRMEGDGAGVMLPMGGISEDDLNKIRVQLQPFIDRAAGTSSSAPEPPLSDAEVPSVEKSSSPASSSPGSFDVRPSPSVKHDGQKRQPHEQGKQQKGQHKPSDKAKLDDIADFLARGK